MMTTWTFPPSNGGEHRGIHEAGIETFTGNLEWYLARETIQNSVDARRYKNKPVKVKFETITIPRATVTGLDDLTETFEKCLAFWPDDADATAFFTTATRLAKANTVSVLRVSDSNTTGVPGDDYEKSEGWYKLVQCSGVSGKAAGSGGSFGIGKSAPFAASALRTVFYSTQTIHGDVAFRGVARLVTHDGDEGTSQSVGYLGGVGGKSIRQANQVPEPFRRNEAGTDLFVLGYQTTTKWKDELLRSVLENFWPAIHDGALEVTIEKTVVTSATLPDLLAQFGKKKRFHAHDYYRAYTVPTIDKSATLPMLGDVSVRLLAGEELRSRVAMVRKTGMVIYDVPFSSLTPYCGVFVCANDEGNERLRSMEPPSHDKWDRDRPQKRANHATADELRKYVQECVQALTPPTTTTELDIQELNQYLPDDGDTPEEQFGSTSDTKPGGKETFIRLPLVTRKLSGPLSSPPGQGGTLVPLSCRAFALDAAGEAYALIVQPKSRVRKPVTITVSAVGDDSEASPVSLVGARVVAKTSRDVPVQNGGRFGPITLPANGPVRFEVTLESPRKLALRVTAHEG